VSPPLVLVDGDTIGRGRTGDEAYTVGLLRELPDAAPDLRFAAAVRDPAAVPPGLPPALALHALPVAAPYRRIPFAFPALARRLGANLVHVHYFAAPRLPCPAVVTVHDASFVRRPELLKTRDRLLFTRFVPGSLRRARRVIAVSEFTRRELLHHYDVDPEKVVVVPNGVGPEFVPQPDAAGVVERRFGLRPPYLLFVGALQPRKNAPLLIEAYARSGLELPLVLAGGDRGGGPLVDLHVRSHPGLERRVRRLGHVVKADLPALYGAAEALVFPSLYEGFGLPALEAMACGTPVAASATTGLGEAVGDAALTFDPCSVEELASALRRIVGEEALRQRLRGAGFLRAAAHTWRRAAEGTAAVYRAAL
jgi:alpha-1,3-rhamnosyl/mannosyltransferase